MNIDVFVECRLMFTVDYGVLSYSDVNSLVLVFVETKRGANELSWFLQRQNVRAVAIHGDLKQFER